MPTKAEAEKMMFGLYDIDRISWAAQELYADTEFDDEGDAKLVLEDALPALLVQRLGAYLEECINTLWNIRFPEVKDARIYMDIKLKMLHQLHEINFEALKAVWKLRNTIAHNSKVRITWRDFDKCINHVGIFVSQFSELEQKRRRELRKIGNRARRP